MFDGNILLKLRPLIIVGFQFFWSGVIKTFTTYLLQFNNTLCSITEGQISDKNLFFHEILFEINDMQRCWYCTQT